MGHRDETEHEELPSRVRLPASVLKSARIRTAPVLSRRLPLTVDLTGEVMADPDRMARIAARVAGRVVEVRMKEGQRVEKGALLVVLSSPEVARARAAAASAKARASAARRNAERLEGLARSGLAAAQEVAEAVAEARSLEAEEEGARRTLLSLGLSVHEIDQAGARIELLSPLGGFIASRSAVAGQSVAEGHVLGEVVDLGRAYFVGRLFEKNLALVRASDAAEVRLNAYPGEVFLGSVESIGKQVDPAARTVTARIAITDRDGMLKVGLFGTARVSTSVGGDAGQPLWETRHPQLVVPLTATTRLAERDVVFVRHPDDDFEVHPVVLGRSAGGLVEVLSGLRAGEQVVVEGVFTLKSAVLKSTFGEED